MNKIRIIIMSVVLINNNNYKYSNNLMKIRKSLECVLSHKK